MRLLLVTEKFNPEQAQRDGGSRLVVTLQNALGSSLKIMQFDCQNNNAADWRFVYPISCQDRFKRRLANAKFIGEKIKEVENLFTGIIFLHVSMQFCLHHIKLKKDLQIITFPMFLTPSYELSGEIVPIEYFNLEYEVLQKSDLIITPSYFEKRQLNNNYGIENKKIRVIPRGVATSYNFNSNKTFINGIKFCSIGSIKPQKNTLDLIALFSEIHAKYKTATLKIIGPIQDQEYGNNVKELINKKNLEKVIELKGYVTPTELPDLIQDYHIHISSSLCETFGRSIFETLAAGIPNIVNKKNNAAADFISHLPYARFVENNSEALNAIDDIIRDYNKISLLASEIGILYDDTILSRLLVAEICKHDTFAISDFDGTLYHKTDFNKTQASMEQFRQFPKRAVCSARTAQDLLQQLKLHNLEVDWIIANSGAVVMDGKGNLCWQIPLTQENFSNIKKLITSLEHISYNNEILQACIPKDLIENIINLRIEVYQDKAFISQWEASKLHAIIRLLKHINHQGRIRVFGDGIYDTEMITYFDGTLVKLEGDLYG